MDIKTRKKKLINELMEKNPETRKGQKIVSTAVLTVLALRFALMLYEIIFFSVSGIGVSVISNLLLLPLAVILYMVFDGNKGIALIPVVSAVIRAAIYFSGKLEELSAVPGGNVYTAVFLSVMLLQFAISLLVTYASKCQEYFKLMQTVNFQIQKEFLSGRGNNGRR